jgi:hypothetical protein
MHPCPSHLVPLVAVVLALVGANIGFLGLTLVGVQPRKAASTCFVGAGFLALAFLALNL